MNSIPPVEDTRNTPIQVPCEEIACASSGQYHEVRNPADLVHSLDIGPAPAGYIVRADKEPGKAWEVWIDLNGISELTSVHLRDMTRDLDVVRAHISLMEANALSLEDSVDLLARFEKASQVRRALGDVTTMELSVRTGIPLTNLERRLLGRDNFTTEDLHKISKVVADRNKEFLATAPPEVRG